MFSKILNLLTDIYNSSIINNATVLCKTVMQSSTLSTFVINYKDIFALYVDKKPD